VKISCFTFLRNAHMLGYPFVQSIKSALPLCDEFIVNVGDGKDDTLEMVRSIPSPKIRVLESQWNEKMTTKGYVYGQQKSIAHFNCTGDWALYLEADEVLHEDDLPRIRKAMERYLDYDRVEALAFDYIHFYGNHFTCVSSPSWYRKAVRAMKNSVRSFSPDGLYFIVLESKKKGRYPRAALSDARIYHYGYVRSEEEMNEKSRRVGRYWGTSHGPVDYSMVDPQILKRFDGTHPAVMEDWLPKGVPSVFTANPGYVPTLKDKKHRLAMKIEKLFGLDITHKHFKLIK
jgi:glycosyltransferase involved in cell wall biosynthesis